MADKTPALRLGVPARFQDRWAGKVASIEISEDWEVYNVAIRHGLFKAVTVRLPLEAATEWGDECVAFDQVTSKAAFGREVPPVAAPSRPVSGETPITGGGTLAGLLISRATRHAGEVLIERGGRVYRVPVEGISFQGKTMYAGVPSDPLVPYYGEDDLRERVKTALASVTEISSGELQSMEIEAAGPGVRLTGNVRTRQSREAALRAVRSALGIPVSTRGLITDIEVETELGLALERAGLMRGAEVFGRSILGDVILRGRARTAGAAQEVARAAAKVSGVRSVVNRMEVGSPDPGRPAGAAAG